MRISLVIIVERFLHKTHYGQYFREAIIFRILTNFNLWKLPLIQEIVALDNQVGCPQSEENISPPFDSLKTLFYFLIDLDKVMKEE